MKHIVCFGEILWDMLPTGKKLGGAPLNVALRAQSLGNEAKVISAIGNDDLGIEIMEEMKACTANTGHIQISKHFGTSVVWVHLDGDGSATYEIKKPCAWDDIELLNKDAEAVKNADAFIYGSLCSRSATTRQTLFGLLDKAKFKVFDVNLRPPHYTQEGLEALMRHADFIKFNHGEIYEVCTHMGHHGPSLEDRIKFIAQCTGTAQICVTLGQDGAVLYHQNTFYYNKGYKVTVADTVGAGDSFLATLIDNLLKGESPPKAIDHACAIGAIVASRSGANPVVSTGEMARMMQQDNY